MRRHPWWGCPPIAESGTSRKRRGLMMGGTTEYLRVRKGSLVICRPSDNRPKWMPMSLSAHLWKGSSRNFSRTVENGTYAVFLGRTGPFVKLLIDGIIYRSHARRWGLVDPPKKLTRFSSRGVPVR